VGDFLHLEKLRVIVDKIHPGCMGPVAIFQGNAGRKKTAKHRRGKRFPQIPRYDLKVERGFLDPKDIVAEILKRIHADAENDPPDCYPSGEHNFSTFGDASEEEINTNSQS